MKRTPMKLIKAIAQAVAAQGVYRKALKEVDSSLGTISHIKKCGEGAGLGWQELAQLSEEELQKIVYSSPIQTRPQPNFEEIDKLLRKYPKLTRKALYEQYRGSVGEGAYSYERYCSLYRLWKKENKPVKVESNLFYWWGERFEIDYSGDKIVWIDYSGQVHESDLFVGVTTHSGLLYCLATEDQSQESWIMGTVGLIEFSGKACSKLVFDNAKALVKKTGPDGAVVQEAILVLCDKYLMVAEPCPPNTPRAKAYGKIFITGN